MATRRHRLAPAADGVSTTIDHARRAYADVQRALRFGFDAKLCMHPRQVDLVHNALLTSDADVRWAERVIAADAASGGAVIQLDGRMVDAPLVLQACRTLARMPRRSRQPARGSTGP